MVDGCGGENAVFIRSRISGTVVWYESPSNIKIYTHEFSPTWLPECELHKDDTNELVKLNKNKKYVMKPQAYTKNQHQLSEAGAGGLVTSSEEFTNWLPSPKRSAFKT